MQRISEVLETGNTFYDVGANVGCYTLLGQRRVGDTGQVVAFEPVPTNLAILRRHLELNEARNVEVIPAAVGDYDGDARFTLGHSRSTGRLASSGQTTVRMVTIDAIVSEGQLRLPNVIKIDVEGAAGGCFAGAYRTLAATRPTIFLAVHDANERNICTEALSRLDYDVKIIDELAGNWMCVPR